MKKNVLALVSASMIVLPSTQSLHAAPPVQGPIDVTWAAKCDGQLARQTDDFAGPGLVGNLNIVPMYSDGARYRKTAMAGADACAKAMLEATDSTYREYLGLVRSYHFLNAGSDLALAAARDVQHDTGGLEADSGVQRTIGSSALYLEAEALIRMGRIEEAEDAALKSALVSGMDIGAYARAIVFARLTPRMTDAKREFIARLARFNSAYLDDIAEMQAWTGDFAAAVASMTAMEEIVTAERRGQPAAFAAMIATYAMLAGDGARATKEMARARAALGTSGSIEPPERASIERMLDFTAAGMTLAAGRPADARAMLAKRSDWVSDSTTYYEAPDWLELRPPAVIAMLRNLAGSGVRATSMGFPFSLGAEGLESATFRQRLAYLASPSRVPAILPAIQIWATSAAYRRAADMVWQIGDAPRFLKRRGCCEEIALLPDMAGATAGDALLLHAALIARSRGKRGFALSPWRYAQKSTVRFGNPGEPGFPVQATLVADDVIGTLAPLMPNPASR